jgi:anti-sigma factor RsiW
MKCQIENRRHRIAAYLTGELSEVEMNEFEQHYFQCEDCFQELKIGRDAVTLLEKEGPTVLAIPASWWEKTR